jgi:truncated hemoglobin YjbI
MTRATAYQKRYAKARQRRRHTATERLQRDHAQAQRVAKVLEQALDDLGLPEDLVTEIEGRLRSQAIDTDMFTQLGCDLTGKKIVVVKSA